MGKPAQGHKGLRPCVSWANPPALIGYLPHGVNALLPRAHVRARTVGVVRRGGVARVDPRLKPNGVTATSREHPES